MNVSNEVLPKQYAAILIGEAINTIGNYRTLAEAQEALEAKVAETTYPYKHALIYNRLEEFGGTRGGKVTPPVKAKIEWK